MARQYTADDETNSTSVLSSWLAGCLAAVIACILSLAAGAPNALAADGLAAGEAPPSWVAHKFAHFMPPKPTSPLSQGVTQQLAGNHGETLKYWGGPVQTAPELYLLFWGSNFWNNITEPIALYNELHFFYESLGGEIQFPYTEGWQGILTQYTNVQGPYKDARIAGESHINAIQAPKNLTNAMVENEASEYIRELKAKGTSPGPNSEIVILTAPETTISETAGCGYHSVLDYEGSEYSYTFVPYAGDATKYYEKHGGGTCNYLESNSKIKGKTAQMMFSTTGVASHEFAESVTDPLLKDEIAWQGEQKNNEVEIADLCEDEPEPIQELPDKEGRLGWTYVFELWDDEGGNKCKLEDPPYAPPAAPSVSVEAATSLGYHQATLNGKVNPNGPAASYYFEWGLSNPSEHKTSEAGVGYGEVAVHENSTITGLKAGTTYHFRIFAANWVGGTTSSEQTFTTPIPPPSVTNESPSNIGDTSATLNGLVNPNGFSTTYQFQYWQAGKSSEVTDLPVTPEGIGAGEANIKVSKAALALEPFTEYRWRIVATNAGGTTNGPESSVAVGPFLALQTTPTMAGDEIALQGVACPTTSTCLAVGSWSKEKSYTLNVYSQLWNGREWKIQTVPNPPGTEAHQLEAVACSSSTACTAIDDPEGVGAGAAKTYGDRWNGTEWVVQTMTMPASGSEFWLSGISCGSAASCIAVGDYLNSTGHHVPMVQHWNGAEWKLETTPVLSHEVGELKGVSCTSATACTAVGSQYISGTVSGTLTETWNGTTWKVQSSPNPAGSSGTTFRGVSCTSASFCAAAGEWTEGKAEGYKTLVEQWNGTEWKLESTPNPNNADHLWSVTCSSSNACSAVGYNETAGHTASLEERWNGTIWTVRTTPDISGEEYLESLHSMSCASLDMCIAVGTSGPYHWQPLVEAIAAPVATTEAATSVSSTSATMNGTVNPEGWETTYHLEYGKTTEYGTKVPVPDARLSSESVAERVSRTISGLSPETTYHYRLVASNAAGIIDGSDQSFKTLASNAPPAYASSFGSKGTGAGQFEHPGTVAEDNKGHLWVLDRENCRAEEFTEKGEYLGAFGSCGFYENQWEPGSDGLAVDDKGHIFILNNRSPTVPQVKEFSEAGQELKSFNGSLGGLSGVEGFAVDPHGDVWIVSRQEAKIEEFNEKNELVRTVGTKGTGPGQFEEPEGAAFAPNGDLLIADSKNNRVVVLNEKGEYLSEFGTAGSGNGQFKEPFDLTVDSKGDAWVVDDGNYRAEEFSEKGEYMTQFGTKGSGAGQMLPNAPAGLTVSAKREIWIADSGNNRIEKWE